MPKTWKEVTEDIAALEKEERDKIIDACEHNDVKVTYWTATRQGKTIKAIRYHCKDCGYKFERDGQLYPEIWNKRTEDIAALERKDIYVIVSEKGDVKSGGLVHEQEVDKASLQNLLKRMKHIKNWNFGRMRIAKLEFVKPTIIAENCPHENLSKSYPYDVIRSKYQEFIRYDCKDCGLRQNFDPLLPPEEPFKLPPPPEKPK